MSFGSAVSAATRAVLIAAATGAAVFGLLVIVHPFVRDPGSPALVFTDTAGADALHRKIDAARQALRATEAALDKADAGSPSLAPGTDTAAQIASATERRDLALRSAGAIRDALAAHTDLSALAGIRDSSVIGQLLARQSALDSQIAEQGARFKANHPVMRGLAAQKQALTRQIEAEAAGIASALQAEAKSDDAQIKLLQSRQNGVPDQSTPAPDIAALQATATAQRAELDSLMDAYFGLEPAAPSVAPAAAVPGPLSLLNLVVVAIAAIAALIFQIGLALRRRRQRREARDLAAWQRDTDADTGMPAASAPVSPPEPALRRAS